MKNKQFEIFDRNYADKGELVVAHSGDFPGNVILFTPDNASRDSYGRINLDLPAHLMREIGEALIELAKEAEELPK